MNENENVDVNEVEEVETQETKTYTQDEMLNLIQSETDKRVQQALKTQQKKYEKELAKSKSLSQLDEEGRVKAEKDMRITELEDQLKEFYVLQNKNEITKVLGARGLNPQFADLIHIGEDAEEAQQKIDALDKLFKQAVKVEVEKRLSTSTPKTSTVGLDGQITKEQFAKMTLMEKSNLSQSNKELYMQLTKR